MMKIHIKEDIYKCFTFFTYKSLFFAYPDQFVKHGNVSDIEKKYRMDTHSIKNKIHNEIKKAKNF